MKLLLAATWLLYRWRLFAFLIPFAMAGALARIAADIPVEDGPPPPPPMRRSDPAVGAVTANSGTWRAVSTTTAPVYLTTATTSGSSFMCSSSPNTIAINYGQQ